MSNKKNTLKDKIEAISIEYCQGSLDIVRYVVMSNYTRESIEVCTEEAVSIFPGCEKIQSLTIKNMLSLCVGGNSSQEDLHSLVDKATKGVEHIVSEKVIDAFFSYKRTNPSVLGLLDESISQSEEVFNREKEALKKDLMKFSDILSKSNVYLHDKLDDFLSLSHLDLESYLALHACASMTGKWNMPVMEFIKAASGLEPIEYKKGGYEIMRKKYPHIVGNFLSLEEKDRLAELILNNREG